MDSQLKKFIDRSEQHLNDKETVLKKHKDAIITEFERILNDQNLKGYMLNGRVKKSDSLKEKIVRKIKFYEDSNKDAKIFIDKILDDIIGIRIICLLNEDEVTIYKSLQTFFNSKINIDEKMHLVNNKKTSPPYLAYLSEEQPVPQKNGKGIYKLKLKYVTNEDEFINIELQIKSLTHMFWGELEHMLFYKNYKYNLDNDFYSKMMFSVNSILENLDTQLKDLKSHMHKDDKIRDTQNMLTKTLYNSLHDRIKKLHDIEFDLREIYSIISMLLFLECEDYSESLEISQDIFSKLTKLNLSLSDFEFSTLEQIENWKNELKSYITNSYSTYEFFDEESVNVLEGLTTKLDELSRGNDIFWCYMIGIHIKLSNSDVDDHDLSKLYNESLFKITLGFSKSYTNKYIDGISDFLNDYETQIEEDKGEIGTFINNCILTGIMDCFYDYKKMDYFLEDVHQQNIINIILEFIDFYQKPFIQINNIKKPFIKKIIQQVVILILKIQIKFYLYNKVDKSDLKELKSSLQSLEEIKEVKWNSLINSQNLDLILENKTKVTTLENLLKTIYFE
ncbi:hypothetical protein QUF83_03660 [Bacillus cereus]|uniref:hypothetical protein n=1 Tax=Bacillus cereus TaxID=1396 RepID=UPI0025A19FB9|nr:hypothetical protein [Bacillus cereus]MDM5235319.1 hypothetical protein [Bacillus cereus]